MPGSGFQLGRGQLKGDSANIFLELQGSFSSRMKASKGLVEVEKALYKTRIYQFNTIMLFTHTH